jgi:arginine-tRNA-protein transferase
MSDPQTFSHYPTWPPPVSVRLATIGEDACSYLPHRMSMIRAMLVREMPAEMYRQFMDAGFRRSGTLLYQPACRGCRACVPLRVPVESFRPSKSQRRCWRKNVDLTISIESDPTPTDEKFQLYCRYLREWHERDLNAEYPGATGELSRSSFESFLYDSPVDTVEFTYRDVSAKLLAVGICDISSESLSSVYCFFDPASARRALGTYAALREMEYARINRICYYYLGYWVSDCRTMSYKSDFRPYELLGTDGVWRVPQPADPPHSGPLRDKPHVLQ